MYILNNWNILQRTKPDGTVVMRLRGEVFGNPQYTVGDCVTISVLVSCRQEGDTLSVMTRSGSEYVLGKPHPDEADAVARVLKHLRTLSAAATTQRNSR